MIVYAAEFSEKALVDRVLLQAFKVDDDIAADPSAQILLDGG